MQEPLIKLNKLAEKPEIIGKSKVFLDTLQKLFDYSQHRNIAILLYGESGVGKSFLARSCGSHNFVSVNCGSVTDTLVNSLFGGHIRGAFTDAKKAQSGFVASAEGGTLFLDEIGDLGLSAQPLLLTIIEEKEYIVVGENFPRKADVQIIAATNKDLNKMVSEATFRGDLLERLTIKIYVPNLNERGKEDISLLCDYLFTKHETELNKECSSELRKKFLELALLHDWKNSNIRGLSNFIFQAVVEERIPEVMETSSKEIKPKEIITGGSLIIDEERISISSTTREITFEDLLNVYFNPEKSLAEMAKQLENDYMAAAKDLTSEEAADLLGIKKGYYKKYSSTHETLMDEKIKITLNQKTSLRDILNHFKMKAYSEMEKRFPDVPLSKIMKKLGENEQGYYNRKKYLRDKLDSELHLGKSLLLAEETKTPEAVLFTPDEMPKLSDPETSQTFSSSLLQNQINDFFEKFKLMEAELENLRAEHKFFEEQYKKLKHSLFIK